MPRNTCDCADGTELVNNVAWYEVDVVVMKLDTRVTYPFTSHLVQLGFISPRYTLKQVIHTIVGHSLALL